MQVNVRVYDARSRIIARQGGEQDAAIIVERAWVLYFKRSLYAEPSVFYGRVLELRMCS